MTKRISRFLIYACIYIQFNAALMYMKWGLQQYFVTILRFLLMLLIFFLVYHSRAVFLGHSHSFFPLNFIQIEDKRNRLQIIFMEMKTIHIFCKFLMTVDIKEMHEFPYCLRSVLKNPINDQLAIFYMWNIHELVKSQKNPLLL